MRVTVCTEAFFDKDRNGHIWTDSSFSCEFWQRYLEVFDEVNIVARVKSTEVITSKMRRIDGPKVQLTPLPYFRGPKECLKVLPGIFSVVNKIAVNQDALILRVGSLFANLLMPTIYANNRPFALEIVGDPWEVFAPDGPGGLFRPFYRWWFSNNLKRQCQEACATAYVTQESLQHRYPPRRDRSMTTHYSSIDLKDDFFVTQPKRIRSGTDHVVIGVGSLEQLYKGPDLLVEAIRRLTAEKFLIRAIWLGDGRYREQIARMAKSAGITGRFDLRGWVAPGEDLKRALDGADLFVMPSRTEGMPRAMIEAMARALPCIGAEIGGIPELLPKEALFAPNDSNALAAKIREVLSDPIRAMKMSEQNIVKALDFSARSLRERRLTFYNAARNATEQWLNRQMKREIH